MNRHRIFFYLASLFLPLSAFSQALGTACFSDPLAPGYIHRAAVMLSSANPLGALTQTVASAADFDALTPDEQARWLALQGAALFEREDPECVSVLQRLASDFPASPLATQAILSIGDWNWLHSKWHEALDYYSEVDINGLADGQRELYSYRKALAYIKCGLPENAVPLLKCIEYNPEYARAAKFYSAYIRYLAKDYDAAYQMMMQVAQSDAGESRASSPTRLNRRTSAYVSDGIEPLYYITQIDYLRGDYDNVIDHSSKLMAKFPVEELLPELHRIVGLSHFKTGNHEEARAHLETFIADAEAPNDDAVYALGALLYSDGELNEAERLLRSVTDRNNILSQGAYLLLGQIAEQNEDMNAAAMAFEKAARMAFDPEVAETARFNHIVALTKGGNAPFASSISMLEDFLKNYPDSRYASDVRESLAAAYFFEHDYAKALASINGVRNPSRATLATKQKILYRLGSSELTTGSLMSAAAHLREAADMTGIDAALADEARLWLAEAQYAMGDYKGAASSYSAALKGSLDSSNRSLATYGLAYAAFKTDSWKDARKNFAIVAESNGSPDALRGDALIREADCLLNLGDYQDAEAKYLKASRDGLGDADYAAFRHAVVKGVTDGTDSKMRLLDDFLKQRSNSKWTPEVLLEAGQTLAALDMPQKAAPYFDRLSKEFPNDNKSRTGALSLALSYMKQGDTDKAKKAYREIISKWPSSEEASVANDDMRRICAADGTIMDYSRFLSGIDGAPKIDPDEMDAISFEAAETAYAANGDDTKLLEQYVASFPDGRFLANALMDLAEASDQAGDPSRTLIYIDRLLSARPDAPQVPAALFLKADLLENAANRKKALDAYLALEKRGGLDYAPEAVAGVMRTTDDPQTRTAYARRLLSMGGVNAEDAEDARFYEASGLLLAGDTQKGVKNLETLAKTPNSLAGAKSAVTLGRWRLSQGDIKGALSTLEAFTDAGSVHSYWLARGFIALAQAYHADGNDYLAAEYLRSLRNNYPGDEPDIAEDIETGLREYSK